MRCTNNNPKIPLHDPVSNQPGRCEGNTPRATRVSSPRGKGLDKPCSTLPLHQKHGTTNQSQWISIEPEHLEGTGEVEEGVHLEGTQPEWKMLKSREGFRMHVLIAVNRDTLLAIAPQSRSAPIQSTAQLIDWSPEDNESDSGTTVVDSIYQQLNALPKEDQEELMMRMGAQEGNFSEA